MAEVKILDYERRAWTSPEIADSMISYYLKNERTTKFAEIHINELRNVFNGNEEYSVVVDLPGPKKEQVKKILDMFKKVKVEFA